MTFDILKKSSIYIYGGGELGRSFFRQLKRDGFNVKGIIDKNAGRLKAEDGLLLINVDSFTHLFNQDDIVIVCVHNALWHTEIVESLKTIGVNNILFIPLSKEYSRLLSNEMMKAYNRFINREYELLKSIPTLSSLGDHSLLPVKSVIRETTESVVCWMDITSLYTSESVGYATKRNAPKELEEYADTPIPGMMPYVNLFRLLAGMKGGEADSFVRLCKRFQNTIDEYSDDEFLYDRFDLYNELSTQLNFGIDRFIESAPDGKWNKKGFFNLLDGMSRTTFLYIRGHQYVPVKIKKHEYEDWVNEFSLRKVAGLIPESTKWEIEHPGFIEYPVRYSGAKVKLLSFIEEYFNKKKWKDKIIIDYTETDGNIARYFSRQGAYVYRVVEETAVDFERSLIELFSMNNSITIVKEEQEIPQSDVICISVNLCSECKAKRLIRKNDDASIVSIFHNMNFSAIEKFEEELSITPNCQHQFKGRDTFDIRIYKS